MSIYGNPVMLGGSGGGGGGDQAYKGAIYNVKMNSSGATDIIAGTSRSDGVIYSDGVLYCNFKKASGQGNQYLQFNVDSIDFTRTSTADTGFMIGALVDITDYDTLYITGTFTDFSTGQYGTSIGIAPSFEAYTQSLTQYTAFASPSATEQTIQVDVSSYSGDYYVILRGWGLVGSVREIGLV